MEAKWLFSAETCRGCLGWKKLCLNPANPAGILLEEGCWVGDGSGGDTWNISVTLNFEVYFQCSQKCSQHSLNKVKSTFQPSYELLVITKIKPRRLHGLCPGNKVKDVPGEHLLLSYNFSPAVLSSFLHKTPATSIPFNSHFILKIYGLF